MTRCRFLPALLLSALPAGCGGGLDDPRAAEIASTLARAEAPVIRARPALAAGKLARMAADPYSFYRGSLPLFRHDWEAGSLASPLGPTVQETLLVGDPHPENFGVLRARDGSFGVEANDFDSADRGPHLWDLRRLTVGVSLAARLSNADDPAAREEARAASRAIARAAVEGYQSAIHALAAGAPPGRLDSAGGEPVLADLFDRSAEATESREELLLTTLRGGSRRINRGAPDPEVPWEAHAELPPDALAALPAVLRAYRSTLIDPPPPEFFTLLDAVRVFGSGVASWPRVRALLLVRGPSDAPEDDVLLELKEISDAGLDKALPPDVSFPDNRARVLGSARHAWAIPDADPLWGTSRWVGFDVQIKTESEGQKGLRLKRLRGDRGTVAALTGLARALGALVARIHAAPPGDATLLDGAVAGAAFAEAEADLAEGYADRVLADHALFAGALAELGPRLGIPWDDRDAPRPDLAALYGTPPDLAPE